MVEFTPRLTKDGIYESKYYYDDNPFHWSGNGLPNCTAYAWGRFYEITDAYPHNLPLGNGGTWYSKAVEAGQYQVGDIPALGAVVCYGSTVGAAGHVAIVEEIHEDGSFTISQSGYNRPILAYPPDTPSYFWTDVCDGETKFASWMDEYVFQGFIYNPEQPVPSTPSTKKKKMPLWMYMRHF